MLCVITLSVVLPVSGPETVSSFRLASEPVAAGPMAGCPDLADLDGDGDLDVVIACGPCCGRDPDPASGHARVLLNDGSGRLTYADRPVKLLDSALGVAVGDVNGDGIPDVVAYHHADDRFAVLHGLGGGRLSEPFYFGLGQRSGPHVHSIRLADVDNDGHLDVLATLVDDHALAVHLGDGRGSFKPALGQPYFAHRHPYQQLHVSDLNGDGNVDAAMTDMRGGGFTVLVGSGTGMFAPEGGIRLEAHTPITLAERPMAADLADLDGDGDLDAVAVIDESPLAVVLMNEGGGRFGERTGGNPVALAVPTTSVALGDVTGDGIADLITGGTIVESISVCAGRGDGSFAPAVEVAAGGRSPSVVLGDMNGDGVLDVVTGNYDSGTVSVLLSQATPGG